MAYLGIDIGGTKIVLCASHEDGEPLAHRRLPTRLSGDWRADLDALAAEAKELLAEEPVAKAGALRAVGVSVPGPADPSTGVLINPPNLAGWENVPIGPYLADALGVPVAIENDANAAALAEGRFGAGRGVSDFIFLTMSTGVGSGIVSEGRLVRGAFGAAGEAGHLPIVPGGEPCACGLKGCLEAYVGGNAWRDRLRREGDAGRRALELAGGSRADLSPEHVVAAAREGDAEARAAFARWVEDLALGLVPLVMLFEPRRVLLGTIAIAAGQALCFDPLTERVRERLWSHQADRLEILPGALGDEMPRRAGLAVALSVQQPR